MPAPARRLEDDIRELCGKVVGARDGGLEPAIAELKVALRQHTQRLRTLAAKTLTGTEPPPPERRRAA